MADQRNGGITWTEQTWNPVRGCRRITDECRNCYAERVAARFSKPGQPYHGLAEMTTAGPRWTGKITLVEDHLLDPLRWKRPRLVFSNSMSDLFYEDLATDQIDRIVAVMAMAGRHTFQVLTKRVQRMADYLADPTTPDRIAAAAQAVQFNITGWSGLAWPLPNVWWGFSAGRQATFDAAIPQVQRMDGHAAVVWWSAEPLLEAIETDPRLPATADSIMFLDWVVVGGESQDGCRPMNTDWARWILHRARRSGTRFHMKQLGGHPDPRKALDDLPQDLRIREYPTGYQRPAKSGGRI